LFRQRFGFLARRLSADRARRRFFVVDLARLFRKPLTDVLGIAHDLAQLGEETRIDAGDRIVRRDGSFGHGSLRFRDAHFGRRAPLDIASIADRARHEARVLLAAKIGPRLEPALEGVSAGTDEVVDDHELSTFGALGWLTPSARSAK